MDFTKRKMLSLEKINNPIFDASLVSHYNYHPSLMKKFDETEIRINRDAYPLNLSIAQNGKPLESKVKNVLRRIRVGIETTVDCKVVKKEKNESQLVKVPSIITQNNDLCVKNLSIPTKKLKKEPPVEKVPCIKSQKNNLSIKNLGIPSRSDSKIPVIPVTAGINPLNISHIKAEPIRKNLLDLKVKNVIKRLRVGIIKDLNDKDPEDLIGMKNKLSNSIAEMIPKDALNASNVKMEFEEDSRLLDLGIVKQESFIGNASQVSNDAEEIPAKNNCLPVNVTKRKSVVKSVNINKVRKKSTNQNSVEKYLPNVASVKNIPKKLIPKVNLVTGFNDSSLLDRTSSVEEKKLYNSFDKNGTANHNTSVNSESISPSEELLDVSLVENKLPNAECNDYTKVANVHKERLKETVVVEKPCVKNKIPEESIVPQELAKNSISLVNHVKNDIVLEKMSNAIESKSKKTITKSDKILHKVLLKKKMDINHLGGNRCKKKNSPDMIINKGNGCNEKLSGNKVVRDGVVKNNSSRFSSENTEQEVNNLNGEKNEKDVKNLLIMKIVRKKGSKTGKLEVHMVEKKPVERDDVNESFVKSSCIGNNLLSSSTPLKKDVYVDLGKNLLETNLSDYKEVDQNESLIPDCNKITDLDNSVRTGSAINDANSYSVERSENLMSSMLFNFGENSLISEKVIEDGEFIPTDILQTEILQSYTCVLCNNDQVIPFNEISDKSDLFVCQTCENLLDKDEIKMKLENIKNSTKCSVLNVTCFKCNLSFSSEKEIELHNLTHKNDDNSIMPLDMGGNIRPQFCRLCHKGRNVSTNQLCVHLSKRRHKCEYCFKLFLSKSDLRKHVNIHTREVTYDCKLCDRSFSCHSNLRKHMETHDDKRERLYKCEYCEKSFYKPDHLKVHVNVHTSEKLYECPYCEKTFTRKYCLQLHINIHTLEKIYECTVCGRTCMDKSTLRKHMALHSDESPYKCEHCDRSFKQKTQLDAHTNSHTLSKLYFCDYCNKSFINKTNLRKHIELHMGNKEGYLCLFCNKMYSSKGNLCIHINRHTNLKSYDCTYCSRSFKDPSSLKKHVNIHTKENKFHCAECGKVFIRKTHLKNHINSHMGIKPYKCEICGKSFTQRSYLKLHMENTHEGLKRFNCTECDKQFKTKTNLDVHMNTHTREKLFFCLYCEKVCSQKANLQTHISKYHADEINDDLKLKIL